ncbi:hypothetical protein D3C73_1234990 [compost metagenome]
MLSVDAVQASFAVVIAGATTSPAGAVGAVVSLLSDVFILTALLAADRLPAASIAFTVNA